ncbi:hypothetical protein [Opitutus sp. GAS368]|uniref:hypothetical protein n=1 Tax=Opitutus sp. GAS368 TaxID=1882749 RepID=UPI0012FDCB4E|nr:hypothetical protein [Opitutus sp. GAS368]
MLPELRGLSSLARKEVIREWSRITRKSGTALALGFISALGVFLLFVWLGPLWADVHDSIAKWFLVFWTVLVAMAAGLFCAYSVTLEEAAAIARRLIEQTKKEPIQLPETTRGK